MQPGEQIIFNAMVEPGGPKRRASRLLAMAVAPKKQQHRPRELILTTHRLLCVKHKPGRAVQVRAEMHVKPPSGKDKEKDLRSLVTSIEPKGEREFVVITVSLGFCVGFTFCISEVLTIRNSWSGRAADEVVLLRCVGRPACVYLDTQDPGGARR